MDPYSEGFSGSDTATWISCGTVRDEKELTMVGRAVDFLKEVPFSLDTVLEPVLGRLQTAGKYMIGEQIADLLRGVSVSTRPRTEPSTLYLTHFKAMKIYHHKCLLTC